jgi:UDP-glucose 4-epimerase
MNFVLTGATGFIGTAVVKNILENGDVPVVLIRNNSNLKRLEHLENIVFIKYDSLEDLNLIKKLQEYSPECFIHLAWKGVSGADRNSAFQITENIPFTLQSVFLAKQTGCKHWIGIGSQAEYGNPNCKINENFPTIPTTLYGKAKLSACWAATGLCDALEMQSSWIRVFSTYGIGDEPHWFIPYIINELKQGKSPSLTKCEQLWDYLFVDDAASAILSVAYQKAGGIFNIGTGHAQSLRTIVDLIKNKIDSSATVNYGVVPYRPDQVMHLEADVSKIFAATRWKFKVTVEEGIKRIINDINQK